MRPIPQAILIFFFATFILLGVFLMSLPLARPLPMFSSMGPSIFPKSAIIALADDRSTFFLARPAAFGPELPEAEEEGRVWRVDGGGNGGGGGGGGGGVIEPAPVGLTGRLIEAGEDGCADVPPPKEEGDGNGNGDGGEGEGDDEDAGVGEDGTRLVTKSADLRGMIVLIPRGGCGFLEKVLWAQTRGAIAVVVGDNIGGRGLVTMYAKGDTSNITIPSVFTTHTTAQLLISLMPASPDGKRRRVKQKQEEPPKREGLWVTLTSTPGPANPFLDTLLVLVVSPLGTLGIVYTMLAIRARIQRRRWRAPKSIVESLPVRVYTTPIASPRLGPAQSPQGNPPPQPPPPLELGPGSQEGQAGPEPLAAAAGGEVGSGSGSQDQAQAQSITPSESESQSQSQKQTQAPQQQQPQQHQNPQPQHLISGNTPSSSLECVVCLEDYVPHVSRVMKLPCGHEFHVGCITPWLVTRRRTCPICKGDVVKMVREKGGNVDGIEDVLAEEDEEDDEVVEEQGREVDLESGRTDSSSSGGSGGSGVTVAGVGGSGGGGSGSGRRRRRRGANVGGGGGWRGWVVGIVGGGRGRSIRGLVERDGSEGVGPSSAASASASTSVPRAGGSGRGAVAVDERTPLISGRRRSEAG